MTIGVSRCSDCEKLCRVIICTTRRQWIRFPLKRGANSQPLNQFLLFSQDVSLPTSLFHNFRTSKSGDRLVSCGSRFLSSKVAKRSVGLCNLTSETRDPPSLFFRDHSIALFPLQIQPPLRCSTLETRKGSMGGSWTSRRAWPTQSWPRPTRPRRAMARDGWPF